MNALYLIRLPLRLPLLLRFAAAHDITRGDEGLGYSLHLWLTGLFGELAPKPFRLFESKGELFGYAAVNHQDLLNHARTFAPPLAWEALEVEGVASKPMPADWQVGQRLRLETLTCPVRRHGREEKDAYLHALDRLGERAPSRAAVYRDWFIEQWEGVFRFESVRVMGMRARQRLTRRAHTGRRLVPVERPQALLLGQGCIQDPERFAMLLARGIGRHRAFGFGMVLLAPPL